MKSALAQDELEVKADLARSIGSSVGAFLGAVHSTELSWHGKPGPAYDQAYESWSVSSNRIASQISVYFPASKVNDEWEIFRTGVLDLYYIFKYPSSRERLVALRQLNRYFLHDEGLGKWELNEIAYFRAAGDHINGTLDRYLRRLLDDYRSRAEDFIMTLRKANSVLTAPTQPERKGVGAALAAPFRTGDSVGEAIGAPRTRASNMDESKVRIEAVRG
jgi:hypothetical protein